MRDYHDYLDKRKNARRRKRLLLEVLIGCVVLAVLVLAITSGRRTPASVSPSVPDTSAQQTSISDAPAETSALPTETSAPLTEASTTSTETSTTSTGTSAPSSDTSAPPVDVPASADVKKLVAITFDDGPHRTLTPRLLDFMKAQEVRATFFVTGACAKDNPEIIQRAAAEGHQIGNHTYNHKDLTKLSAESRRSEIDRTAELLKSITGQRPTVMRPPYGAQNAAVQAAVDTPIILWAIDPRDWDTRNADKTYRFVMDNVRDGDIVLLHDIHPQTIDAAERIIPALKKQGYVFVTVEELLTVRGKAKAGEKVNSRRPS